MSLRGCSWEAFHERGLVDKSAVLMEDVRPLHVLFAQQFDRKAMEHICALATEVRQVAKDHDGRLFLRSLLLGRRAMLYFSQPSTRTFLSFTSACQILGLDTGEVRDPSISSEIKGETREDSVRTFSSYFDLIIMRTKERGLAERTAWMLAQSDRSIPIINAGSGADQHPSQALLDIYTIQRSFEHRGGIDGKTVVFVGDLARGRTVRSLAWLLTSYRDVRMVFVAPDAFQISADIRSLMDEAGIAYTVSSEFRTHLPEADALYMTRVQDEWDAEGESADIDVSDYCLQSSDLDMLKPDAIIMHPLPRREEVPVEIDADPRAMYWRQMRNGMWVRTALIATMFEVDDAIREYRASRA